MNDNAATLFRSGEVSDVEEGMIIMNEAVIPCMHLMSRPDMVSQEDLDTMEAIRSHWCSYLEMDLDGEDRGRGRGSYWALSKLC